MRYEDIQVITNPGGHKGWTEHKFRLHGIEWRLLTIAEANDRNRSNIYHEDRGNKMTPFWRTFGGRAYDGILTPIGAMRIIDDLKDAFERGVNAGEVRKQQEIRSVLGC